MNRLPHIASLLLALAFAARAQAFTLAYGGRLAEADGRPVAGPLDLRVRFYASASGGSSLAVDPIVVNGVQPHDGIFELALDLDAAEFQTLFGNGDLVWIQLEDL